MDAFAKPLGEALVFGTFEPAPVQREFQWGSNQALALLDDVFAAFERLGLDPDDGFHNADDQPGDDELEIAAEIEETTASEPDEATDDAGDDVEPADNAELVFDAAQLAKVKVKGRGRRPPPEIYNLHTIVLLPAPLRDDMYRVYDGLQRLTTVSLLLACLRDGSQKDSQVRATVKDMLFVQDGERRLLVPTAGATLASIVNGHTVRGGDKTSGDVKMREVYRNLKNRLGGWSDQRRVAFVDFLLRKVYVTIQKLSDESLAYQTFVTANDRGLSLNVGDVLKGQFVEQTSSKQATVDQIQNIERAWNKARSKLHSGGMRDFVPAIETLKFRYDHRAAPGERLLDLFGKESTPDEMVDWITGEFLQFADLFSRMRKHYSTRDVRGVDLRFRQLSFLSWNDWQPVALALALAHPGDLEGPSWARKVNALYRACFTMELLGWRHRRSLQMQQALEQIEQGRNPFDTEPSGGGYGALSISPKLKNAVKIHLRRPFIQEERRGAIIRWLETLYWRWPVGLSCTHESNVEHVLPLSPNRYWASAFSEKERDSLTNLLGNLCILDKQANVRIGNSAWPDKANEYQAWRRQYKTVNQVLAVGGERWSPDSIRKRTNLLANKAANELRLSGLSGRS